MAFFAHFRPLFLCLILYFGYVKLLEGLCCLEYNFSRTPFLSGQIIFIFFATDLSWKKSFLALGPLQTYSFFSLFPLPFCSCLPHMKAQFADNAIFGMELLFQTRLSEGEGLVIRTSEGLAWSGFSGIGGRLYLKFSALAGDIFGIPLGDACTLFRVFLLGASSSPQRPGGPLCATTSSYSTP